MPATSVKPLQRRHVEAVVAIADHGSVHRAATALGMPQPALSRLLAEAETRLGGRLFDRSVHGSKPTLRGRTVLAQARFALHSMQRLDHAMDASGPVVRLGCIPRAMHTLMPHLLTRLHRREAPDGRQGPEPALRISVVEDSSMRLFAALREEELDFAVMRHESGPSGIGKEFAVERLYDERALIVCGRANTGLGAGPVALAELAGHEWILPSPQTTSRAMLERFWARHRLPALRSVIETRTFESNLALVAETPFISVVPEFIARRYERLGLVRILDVRPAFPANPVMLVCSHEARGDAVLELFRGMVHEAARGARKSR